MVSQSFVSLFQPEYLILLFKLLDYKIEDIASLGFLETIN